MDNDAINYFDYLGLAVDPTVAKRAAAAAAAAERLGRKVADAAKKFRDAQRKFGKNSKEARKAGRELGNARNKAARHNRQQRNAERNRKAREAHQRECAKLAATVQTAKKAAGKLGKCKDSDCCATLIAKKAAWVAVGTARSRLHKKCFNGGDAGHQQALAQVWKVVGDCAKLIAKECND